MRAPVQAAIVALVATVAACSPASATAPHNSDNGAYVAGQPSAPVTLTIVEDPLCPGCAAVHRETRESIAEWVASGDVSVRTYVAAFVAPQSEPVANAWACAAQQDHEAEFADAVFFNQPTPDAVNEQFLIGLGQSAQVPDPDSYNRCVADGTFQSFVEQVTSQMRSDGVSQVPLVLVNGVPLQPGEYSASGITTAVENAIRQAGR